MPFGEVLEGQKRVRLVEDGQATARLWNALQALGLNSTLLNSHHKLQTSPKNSTQRTLWFMHDLQIPLITHGFCAQACRPMLDRPAGVPSSRRHAERCPLPVRSVLAPFVAMPGASFGL